MHIMTADGWKLLGGPLSLPEPIEIDQRAAARAYEFERMFIHSNGEDLRLNPYFGQGLHRHREQEPDLGETSQLVVAAHSK